MNRFPGLEASALGNNPVTSKAYKLSLSRLLAPFLFAQPYGWCDVVGVEVPARAAAGRANGRIQLSSSTQHTHTHTRFCPKQDDF